MSDSGRAIGPGDSTPDFNQFLHDSDAPASPPWMPVPSDSAVDLVSESADDTVKSVRPSQRSQGHLSGESLEDLDHESLPRPPSVETKIFPSDQLPAEPMDPQAAGADALAAGPTASTSAPPVTSFQRSPKDRLLLLLLTSYASAVTLGLIAILFSGRGGATHELESLPDIKPLDENEFRFAPRDAEMPPGHTLEVGQSVRFGNILVEPLRVTQGPVEFTHFAGGDDTRPPTPPVLKLWLKFTNVSKDQNIAPLDAVLLWTRHYQVDTDELLTNNLVFSERHSVSDSDTLCVLDHPLTSEWDLKDQHLGYRLEPGESMTTYIPTEPVGVRVPGGKMRWRVHLRKGYHDSTGHGVTTLIEVAFDSAEIEIEPAPASEAA